MKQKLLNKLLTLALFILGGALFSPAWGTVSNGDVFERISSVTELSDGDEIIFVNQAETYACGTTQNTNNRTPVSISVSNHQYTYTSTDNVQVFVVKINNSGQYGFHTSSGYIYSASASKNNLKTNSTAASTAPSGTSAWTLSISSNVVTATNVSNTSYYLAFNGTAYFSQYKQDQSKPYIFRKRTIFTYALTITEPTGGTVTVLDSDAKKVSSGDKFEEGAELTLSAEASTGYTFSTWTKTAGTFGNAATTADNTFTMPAAAATIGATFTKNSYDLSLTNTNGSLAVTVDGDDWDGSSKIPYNAEVKITATPNDGYLFGEWASTDIGEYDEVSNPLTFNMPAGDVEIEASFVDASTYYSITVDDNVTGGSISADKASAAEEEIITLTATPSTGYTFTSWTVKDADDNTITVTDNKFTMPASNVTVTATFTAIAVTSVSLNKTSTSMEVGETETLTATVAPADALNKAVTWTSSNTSVATVDTDGKVTAVAAGSATITVTTTDGSFKATCTVTVVAAITFDATKDTGSTPLVKNGVTFDCTSGVLNNGSEYRLYKNSTTTLSTESGKITKIEFTGVSGNPASGFASQTGWTTDGYDGTWTGSNTSVSFTASGAQVRATKIKVFVATTATPIFSVEEGEYSEAKSVEISCATDGATIYYTTNGDTPTSSSTTYSSAIPITETTTLKAIAIKDEVESDVASATYTMNRPAAPIFDKPEGVFDAAFDLHLSAADGTNIYYTTDGSTPTASSSEYSGQITISATTTVQAIAVKSGLTSDVASATYTYDSRTTPTFTLSNTNLNLKVNDTSDAVTLTTNSDGDISFSCNDAHVTLIGTGNSRTISANAAGEYTVNVSISGSATYKDAAGTITVTVTKKATTMVLTPSFTSKDLYVTTTGSITGVPQYNSSDIDGAEVTYSSSDTKVATIAYDGTITFKKAGSTTITASYAGNDEYDNCEASYVLELTDTTPQATEVDITLNNTFFGCESFTNWTTGMATTLSESHKNITITYSKGASSNMYCSTEKVRFYTDNTFTIVAPAGYNIISVDMNVSISSADPEGAISSDTWTGDANSVSFTFANKTDISSITVTIAPIVTVSAAGYATYASDHNLDFTETNIKAYIATTRGNGTGVAFTQINKVPAGTGVLLYVDGGATEAIPVFDPAKEDADGTDGNKFVRGTGGTIATDDGVNYNYILNNGVNGIGFYRANNKKVAVNRAYICIPKDEIAAADAKDFFSMPGFDDDPTGINDLADKTGNERNEIYNLAGQRINKLQKGINIINGKKILK